jgi:predicted Rossmann-fold nucleotide-binding protein
MQAANEGAGPEHSFGVNIRLPFEQKANAVLEGNPRLITYKYFFNRKVAFLKEADAVALFPGGFGTLDEAMETLTLVQTGKRNPMPLVLVDAPGGTYWKKWFEFMQDELRRRDYIGDSDYSFFRRVDSIEAAVGEINRFYSRYHSMRYVDGKLVIRLTSVLDTNHIGKLKKGFADILMPGGDIVSAGPLPAEKEEQELTHLPRLVVDFNRQDFGRLRNFIDEINRF